MLLGLAMEDDAIARLCLELHPGPRSKNIAPASSARKSPWPAWPRLSSNKDWSNKTHRPLSAYISQCKLRLVKRHA